MPTWCSLGGIVTVFACGGCSQVGEDYRCPDFYNPVDGDEVPVPHFGLALTKAEFDALAGRIAAEGVQFIIPPTLRFEGTPGEQWTMFFKVSCPSYERACGGWMGGQTRVAD